MLLKAGADPTLDHFNPHFLLECDRRAHIAALQSTDGPDALSFLGLQRALSSWRPEPGAWVEPSTLLALATDAVWASEIGSTTKSWFVAGAAHDRAALIYDARNVATTADSLGPPGAENRLAETWLLRATWERSAAEDQRLLSVAWPTAQLTREARAAERTVLQEAVCMRCASAYFPLLVAMGEDVNAAGARDATALHWAAATVDTDLDDIPFGWSADALLRLGAELDAVDRYGRTPLDIALATRNLPTLRTLMNAGAQPSDEQWRSIERAAVRQGWEEWDTSWKVRRAAEVLNASLSSLTAGPSQRERRRL